LFITEAIRDRGKIFNAPSISHKDDHFAKKCIRLGWMKNNNHKLFENGTFLTFSVQFTSEAVKR
jgi:hypothetical protein